MVKNMVDHRYFIWSILALPSIPMIVALASGQPGSNGMPVTERLLHPTGEFSARFLIIAMMLTPLRMLFPGSNFLRWMMKRRRYFGMAAFFYALFHTLLYIVDMGNLRAILGEFLALGIWTGWLAMVVFVPLALTSTDSAIRRLGPRWKTLQRTVYLAAVATLMHWIFVHNNLGPALVHFVPLAGLELYRIFYSFRKRTTKPQRV
ncbi:ferric reductase-like transmembrane domain-containing protein [uncultured Ruegeria sp.]|uniref:sulfite oxidase heme-binding subunit YedZ n=1 Tax=uncultured Ruegeria sp. TaxID=259304 RepID=UPI0026083AC8|nr:ferric reductase-like transmembrane domain-containing protein [uncultured Ruegeria sp.]